MAPVLPPLIAAALAAGAGAAEVHPGNPALHATLLERARTSSSAALVERSRRALSRRTFEIGPDSEKELRPPAMAMELEDMKSEYLGRVGIGTSFSGGALFEARVVFDTGSTNLWVASALCSGEACSSADKDTSNFYDPARSASSKLNQTSLATDLEITFGTGELRGPLAIDTYRLGAIEVTDQPFAMIREMSGDVFKSIPFEGIVGLAFPSLSFGGIQPFFDRVVEQRVLPSNEFAFYLNEDPTKPSAIMWGGVDPDLYTGPIQLFPVVQPHYWSLELVDFRLGNKSYQSVPGHEPIKRIIVDSGTTYYSAPGWFLDEVQRQTPAAQCDSTESYPDIHFLLRDAEKEIHTLSVSSDGYMLEGENKDCTPAWMNIDVKPPYGPAIILGEVFLRRFFTVFRRGNGKPEEARIGFARAKSGATPKVHHEKTIMDVISDAADTAKIAAMKIIQPIANAFDLTEMNATAGAAGKGSQNVMRREG